MLQTTDHDNQLPASAMCPDLSFETEHDPTSMSSFPINCYRGDLEASARPIAVAAWTCCTIWVTIFPFRYIIPSAPEDLIVISKLAQRRFAGLSATMTRQVISYPTKSVVRLPRAIQRSS